MSKPKIHATALWFSKTDSCFERCCPNRFGKRGVDSVVGPDSLMCRVITWRPSNSVAHMYNGGRKEKVVVRCTVQ